MGKCKRKPSMTLGPQAYFQVNQSTKIIHIEAKDMETDTLKTIYASYLLESVGKVHLNSCVKTTGPQQKIQNFQCLSLNNSRSPLEKKIQSISTCLNKGPWKDLMNLRNTEA